MKQRWLDFWAARDARERLLLGLCAGLLLLTLIYLAWVPLSRQQDRLQRRLPQLQQDVQRMQQLLEQWQALAPAAGQSDWQAAAQARLVAHGLPAAKARLLGADAQVQRWQMDDVPFNSMLDWMAGLYEEQGVRVRSIKLEPATPGHVNLTLELHRP